MHGGTSNAILCASVVKCAPKAFLLLQPRPPWLYAPFLALVLFFARASIRESAKAPGIYSSFFPSHLREFFWYHE